MQNLAKKIAAPRGNRIHNDQPYAFMKVTSALRHECPSRFGAILVARANQFDGRFQHWPAFLVKNADFKGFKVAQIDLGWANDLVALAIAVTKAVLVILFFMHVRYSTRMTVITALAGFLWLGILIVLTLNDYVTRYTPQRAEPAFMETPGK